jgi:Asp-tRNA(Asn)/Glu-tRNA(Gln) amidotransferase A subunit family amidase
MPGSTDLCDMASLCRWRSVAVVDVQLQVGAASETVTVTGANQQVQSSTSDLGHVVDNTTMRSLPVSSHNFMQILALSPGPGRTPWNPDYSSGGSSSGPAAATSAALVDFSIGGETGGSIVQPSSHCGIAGIRTTYGRGSRAGSVSLCCSLDKIGPLCRSAGDRCLVLNALSGFNKDDPATSRRRFVYPVTAHSRRLKVAVN